MGRILDAVKGFMQSDGWPIQPLDHLPAAVSTTFKGENGSWACLIWVDEDGSLLSIYSILPTLVSEDRRQQVGELISRVNFGLPVGNLEISYSDGELRFKTSVDVEDLNPLPPTFIKNLLYANVQAMDQNLPKIMAVVEGKKSAAEAAG